MYMYIKEGRFFADVLIPLSRRYWLWTGRIACAEKSYFILLIYLSPHSVLWPPSLIIKATLRQSA